MLRFVKLPMAAASLVVLWCLVLTPPGTVLATPATSGESAEAPAAKKDDIPPDPEDVAHTRHLNDLFDRLKRADSPRTAFALESAIWLAWRRSGSPYIDDLMSAVRDAMQFRRYDLALRTLNQVVKEAPDYPEGWNKRATVLYVLKRYDESIADIERTLALEPRHFGAISGLAVIKLIQGDKPAALKAIREAIAIHPYLRGSKQILDEAGGSTPGSPI